MRVTRFAPSTTGLPHLGTLLSAVLAYVHARTSDGQARLRLEDLDPIRCKPQYAEAMLEILEIFEFEWDAIDVQSKNFDFYRSTLHDLADQGRVYRCACTRSRLKMLGRQTPDGSFAYDNHCRDNRWDKGDAYEDSTLRIRLNAGEQHFLDLCVGAQSFDAVSSFGDPIVVRRDQAFSYHFSSVVDDERTGVTDVVRGRDLLFATPVQIALRDVLQFPVPSYFHHPLLMERRGEKLAKLHGSLPVKRVLEHHTPKEILGKLAYWFGLQKEPKPCSLSSLVHNFSWDLIPNHDLQLDLNEDGLVATIQSAKESPIVS